MFNQFLRSVILLMSTYIYPCAIKRIADDLLALGDEFLNKVGGMEEGIFRNLGKGTLLDEVDAGIGIVVVFWLLNKTFNIATIKVENAELDAHVVGHCCYRHLCIVLLEM